MERDIAKKPRRTLRRTCCKVRLDPVDEDALADHAMCQMLEVSGSGYFGREASRRRPGRPGVRRHSSEVLLAHIRSIREHLRGEYGWLPLQPEVSGHAGFLGHAQFDVTKGKSLGRLKARRLT
jgi:hypothetical protein